MLQSRPAGRGRGSGEEGRSQQGGKMAAVEGERGGGVFWGRGRAVEGLRWSEEGWRLWRDDWVEGQQGGGASAVVGWRDSGG